ncbi:hypothetical protein Baya_12162 [Bagarius yarrelli]|uniref:Uncharacterized protein n=1 Tax=Bagarius yarrelli TaxID=175774 RepID=A0A556V203_BAGYA|nr:hypothetical protein Baya_12162 [Bagarius yarrelli]
MATGESNSAEFQEKPGLKRKLTGPPRLLLGKSRSPVQDGRKSRKHERHNNDGGGDNVPSDTAKDEQSSELHKQTTPECPETVSTTELDEGACVDLQKECLETNLEQKTKQRRRKCNAGMTIRWIFSCGKRKKELGMKAVDDNIIQDGDLLTQSGDSLKTKKPVKKLKVRMWHIFKKRSPTAKQEEEEHKDGRCNDTFPEISPETSVEPTVIEEQRNKSSGTDDDVSRISEKNCSQSQDPKLELTETIPFDLDVNADAVFVHQNENHHHASESHFSSLGDETEPEIQNIQTNSDPEDPTICLEDPVTARVPGFRCKPLITVEDVHLSDEENEELFTNTVPLYGTLSPLLTLNGSCHIYDRLDGRLSEMMLAQTALSLVRAAINGAVNQLSNELQNPQMEDLDPV